MNPLMEALRRAGDARLPPAADGVDPPFGPAGLGDAGPGPVRANRDDADPGTRSPVTCGDDEPFVPAAPGEWRLAPIRATKDDDAPGSGSALPGRSSPARTTHFGGAGGNAGVSAPGLSPGGWGSDAGAATPGGIDWPRSLRIDTGGEDEPAPTPAMIPDGLDRSRSLRIDAGGEDEPAPTPWRSIDSAPEAAGDDPGRPPYRPAPPGPARMAGAGVDPRERRSPRASPERADAREPRSIPDRAFDPRGLPRRRGAGRVIVAVLSLFAVIGAGAAGGYHLWKTELVRPALVRGLPPMPAPIVDLALAPAANAATGEAAGPATGTPLRPSGHPPVPAAESAQAPPASPVAGRSAPRTRGGPRRAPAVEAAVPEGAALPGAALSGAALSGAALPGAALPGAALPGAALPGAALPGAASTTGASASRGSEGVRASGGGEAAVPERPALPQAVPPAAGPAPGNGERTGAPAGHGIASDPLKSTSWPRYAGRASPGSREHVPMPPQRTQPPAPMSAQAVEPGARAAAGSPVGAAGGRAAAMERSGAEPRPKAGPGIEIGKGVRDDHVAVSLERAYRAFRAGELESAAETYRAVVAREPGNRDALLGLAAVAARTGRRGEAAGHYARVLASHPADTVARAALIAIEEPDPARGGSRLKALLWIEPEAAHLHFDLGNAYAAQSRWPEAQRSYFDAYRFDRGNADYAYNLAVSLDQLSRRESALDFYREALALARSRPASFEAAAVLARIRELDPSAGEGLTPVPPFPEPAGAVPADSLR